MSDLLALARAAASEASSDGSAAETSNDGFSVVASQQAHGMPDPFLEMNLGEEMQLQYLSDAQHRLKRPELWTSNAALEIRQLADIANPAAKVQLDELCHKYQEVSVRRVRSLRGNIMAMAHTLVELLSATRVDHSMQQVYQKELQATIQKIEAEFAAQEQEYKLQSKMHYQNVVRCCESSRVDALKSHVGKLASVAVAICSMAALRFLWVASFRPERLTLTSFIRHAYKPVYKDPSGNIIYWKMTKEEGGLKLDAARLLRLLLGPSAGGLLACGLAILWCRRCAQRSTENHAKAKAESLVKVEMEQHQAMWKGTRMAVDAVKDTADRLENLAEADSRTERRQILTRQMLQDLWTMSMAIDEMIVWMSQRGCFPPNYSVRNMVSPARYDKILDTFGQITRSLSQPALGGA